MMRNLAGRAAPAMIGLGLVLGATACGGDENHQSSAPDQSTPKSTLAALVRAINDSNDDAVDRLICAAAKKGGAGFADARAVLVEADPRLGKIRYRAKAAGVTSATDREATVKLLINVVGVPKDVSPEAQQALAVNEIPRPLNQQNERGEIHLVKESGRWVACGPRGVS
jgi:hypothetical protein